MGFGGVLGRLDVEEAEGAKLGSVANELFGIEVVKISCSEESLPGAVVLVLIDPDSSISTNT